MTLTAVLLTGGSSRRMGADKAGLILAGEPLWSRQLRLLHELQPDALWISARSRPAWCPPEIEVVLDAPPSRGPLSGLSAALSRLETSHLLALAVDLPQMTAAHLHKLWSLAKPGCGVLPMDGDYFEPLCAIYPATAAIVAKDALTSNDVSLQSLARVLVQKKDVQIHHLNEADRLGYLNVNTPDDLPNSFGLD
jgi:molybdopterin-guanine dinucleotide biosynthesis protein A